MKEIDLNGSLVKKLNRLPWFYFCADRCDGARIKKGVFQVHHEDYVGARPDPGWVRCASWVKIAYAPEDFEDALHFCDDKGNSIKHP